MWSSSVLSWCTILVSNIHDCASVLRAFWASASWVIILNSAPIKFPCFFFLTWWLTEFSSAKKGRKKDGRKGRREGGKDEREGVRRLDLLTHLLLRVWSCEKLSRRKGDTCCQVTLFLNWSHLQGMGCLCYQGCQQARKGLPNEGPKESWAGQNQQSECACLQHRYCSDLQRIEFVDLWWLVQNSVFGIYRDVLKLCSVF